jgi:hypothetical protein
VEVGYVVVDVGFTVVDVLGYVVVEQVHPGVVVVVVGYPPPALAPVVGPTRSRIAPIAILTAPRIVRRPSAPTVATSGATVISILRRADAPKPDMPNHPFKSIRDDLHGGRYPSPSLCLPKPHAFNKHHVSLRKKLESSTARDPYETLRAVTSVVRSLRPSRRTQRIRRDPHSFDPGAATP